MSAFKSWFAAALLGSVAAHVNDASASWPSKPSRSVGHSWQSGSRPSPSGYSPPKHSSSACHREYSAAPEFHFGQFTYPPTPTASVTVTSNAALPTSTYAVSYAAVSSLFSNLSSTTWGNWVPTNVTATASPSNPYGDAAFTALWQGANPGNFSRGLYSTTVSPTPVPSSELAAPPPLYLELPKNCYQFPKDFVFGAGGSAAQCEGAVADDGKSPSFMDMIFNIFSLVGTGAAGALVNNPVSSVLEPNYNAIEHYYLYKQDIERLAAMGLKYYSFTIQWTRILPFALPGTPVNTRALQHYDDVINFVLSKGMKPIVTLTHFDTPLQFFGGSNYLLGLATTLQNTTYGVGGVSWGYDNSTFPDAFVNYAKIVLSHYADRVPLWITFNEPNIGSINGAAVYHVLTAHAQAHHFYKETLNGTGLFSMKMGVTPGVPLDVGNQSHIEAANFFTDLYVSPFIDPLTQGKDYPEAYKLSVRDYVPLSQADLEYFNNTMDFVSLDAYSAPVISPAFSNLTACAINPQLHTFPYCVNATTTNKDGWSIGYSPFGSGTNYMAPANLRTQLNYVYNTYKKPVVISEFGLTLPPVPVGRLQDNLFNQPTSEYLLSYLNQMLLAIWEDHVDVMGAIVWNFADDWEFGTYVNTFGLQEVNFTTQERRYRRSFFDAIGFVEGPGRRQT